MKHLAIALFFLTFTFPSTPPCKPKSSSTSRAIRSWKAICLGRCRRGPAAGRARGA